MHHHPHSGLEGMMIDPSSEVFADSILIKQPSEGGVRDCPGRSATNLITSTLQRQNVCKSALARNLESVIPGQMAMIAMEQLPASSVCPTGVVLAQARRFSRFVRSALKRFAAIVN